jgi:predicted ester cyclase
LHHFVIEDALVLEQLMTGTVIGEMLGIPGNGRTISFRILHVFEFRDGLVSREQVWLDSAAIIEQLTAP